MPLYNPGILATGGSVTGNLTVTGNLVNNGTHTSSGIASENAGNSTAGSAPVLTPTFSSGVAAQLADLTRDYMVYLQIGTAGSAFSLAVGPANTTTTTIMASGTPTSDELIALRLPAGWWLKWTGTLTTLTTQTAIGC